MGIQSLDQCDARSARTRGRREIQSMTKLMAPTRAQSARIAILCYE